MKILTISGSSRPESSNIKLLDALPDLCAEISFSRYQGIAELPIFRAEKDKHPWPEKVLDWRKAISDADALIISTPEYIHNLPALLKNALEWVTSSGEMMHKAVLPITFTPNPPRGDKAMQSLLWSLKALDARIVGHLPLYQNEIQFRPDHSIIENEATLLLKEAIKMLLQIP